MRLLSVILVCMAVPFIIGAGCVPSSPLEPNNTFDQATQVTPDPSGTTRLSDTITLNDVDVFNLGAFSPGDRIIVDVGAQANGLDAMVAIFDDGQQLVNENDDRNPSLNQLDPFVNHVIRHVGNYFVAVAASPLADTSMDAGSYDATITITRGGEVPATSGQIVAIDTAGGTRTISGNVYTVAPFDAAAIDTSYTGKTNEVLDRVVATMNESYQGLELQVLVIPRDQAQIPAGAEFSTIVLGGQDPNIFGLSDDVDHYDANRADNAIVFANSFNRDTFGRLLSVDELGTAIGNVCAHELGHLLGLNHVDNIHDTMDTTGGPNTLTVLQIFTTSMLDWTIFPIGVQNGVLLLQETLSTTP